LLFSGSSRYFAWFAIVSFLENISIGCCALLLLKIKIGIEFLLLILRSENLRGSIVANYQGKGGEGIVLQRL
jgi:hypothetical protein